MTTVSAPIAVSATRDVHLTKIVIGITAVAVVGALASQWRYSPMWDGRIYADCITEAARNLTPGAVRCAGHASHAYVALVAAVQSIAPGSFLLTLPTNAALLLVACVGFHRLTRLTFPAADQRLDRALLTALFAVQPTLLAGVVQPGLDLPIVPAFIWCVVFALEQRWAFLAAAGVFLVFTKETGVLLYGILVLSLVVWEIFSPSGRAPFSLGKLVRRLAPVVAPLAIFGAYLLYRASLPNEAVMWSGGTIGRSVLSQFLIPSVDLYQLNYAAIILVLGFGWIPSALVGADAIVGAARALRREPPREITDGDRRRLAFVVILLLASGYALTRFITFGNPRYFLVSRVLLLIPAYAALLRFGVPRGVRRALLGVTAALTFASAVRTVDPVSRSLYGTFDVGDHSMLRMTSITGECCGFGRDQLVYNLEFGWLQRAASAALASVAADAGRGADSLLVIVPDSALGTLSSAWLSEPNAVEPGVNPAPRIVSVTHTALLASASRPDSAMFIALPTVDPRRALRELATAYNVGPSRDFDVRGYRVSTYRLTRRPSASP